MFRKYVLVAALATLVSPAVQADNFVVAVHGIVCEFCALGVAKKVRKLPFIDRSQLDKGVRVDIKNQQVFVAVKEDSEIDRDTLFDAIESAGYKPVTLFRLEANGEQIEVAP